MLGNRFEHGSRLWSGQLVRNELRLQRGAGRSLGFSGQDAISGVEIRQQHLSIGAWFEHGTRPLSGQLPTGREWASTATRGGTVSGIIGAGCDCWRGTTATIFEHWCLETDLSMEVGRGAGNRSGACFESRCTWAPSRGSDVWKGLPANNCEP